VVGKEWNPQIVVNLTVTNVPGCVSRNAKTLGLQHLQLSDVGVSRGPPDRACVVHNWTDELLSYDMPCIAASFMYVTAGARQREIERARQQLC
jgi:hypothetical protein